MLTSFPNVLGPNELQWLRETLEKAKFVDGTLSAGKYASRVKSNQELPMTADLVPAFKLFMTALGRNEDFTAATLPQHVAQPVFARYGAGMAYGEHIDDPIMGDGQQRFRCDIACTLFLNQPEDYEGGELTIETAFGKQQVKLPAGHMVIYPASSLHSVAPVTEGQRLVAVSWIQSQVRSPEQRQILFEMAQLRAELMASEDQRSQDQGKRLDRSYTNLVRLWAEL